MIFNIFTYFIKESIFQKHFAQKNTTTKKLYWVVTEHFMPNTVILKKTYKSNEMKWSSDLNQLIAFAYGPKKHVQCTEFNQNIYKCYDVWVYRVNTDKQMHW